MSVGSTALASQDAPTVWRFPAKLALVLGLAVVVRLLFFRGLFPSDDLVYFTRGLEISKGIWTSSDYVGSIRYGTNIPLGIALALFGPSLFSAALAPLLGEAGCQRQSAAAEG